MARGRRGIHWELTVPGIVASAVLAAVGFWLGEMGCMYCTIAMAATMTYGAAPAPDLGPWLMEQLYAPRFGLNLDPWPMLCGAALGALFMWQGLRTMRWDDLEISPDEQYGTAELASAKDWAGYAHVADKVKVAGKREAWPKPDWCEELRDDNMWLAEDARLAISDNPDRAWKPANHHVLMVAGSGAGKTFNYITTNVMQCNASYMFTDPKGELLARFGRFLEQHGYVVKVLDIRPIEENIRNSNAYNPLHYCRTNTQVDDFINRLMASTTSPESKGAGGNQEFFENMERLTYGCIWKMELAWWGQENEEYYNVPSCYEWLKLLRSAGDGAEEMTQLERVFKMTREEDGIEGYIEMVRRRHPECASEAELQDLPEWEAVNALEGVQSAVGSPEEFAGVVSSCYNRLRPFMNAAVRSLFADHDDMELGLVGKRKTAVFVLTADGGGPYDFIASLLTSQLFSINALVADNSPAGHLDIPVICYLDEVANIGEIPHLDQLFNTLRSRWINLVAITQYTDQLKPQYKEAARGIMAAAAIFLYFGAGDYKSCEEISKMLGKKTVHHTERSYTRSNTGSSVTESEKFSEKALYTADELYNIAGDRDKVLVHIANDRWHEGRKPNPMEHPRWAEVQEAHIDDVAAWLAGKRAEEEGALEDEHGALGGAQGRIIYERV